MYEIEKKEINLVNQFEVLDYKVKIIFLVFIKYSLNYKCFNI